MIADEAKAHLDRCFVRAVGEPAQAREIPPPASEPPDFARLTAIAADFGLEIIGPPGIPG